MEKTALIACSSKKLLHKAKAKDLYVSPLFKHSLEYAYSLNPNNIFVLSAKHGLLDLNEKIEPYNLTLNDMKMNERKDWAREVLNQLEKVVETQNEEIIFLAGKKYREHIIPNINNYQIPLEGFGIGEQLKWLKEHNKNP